MIAEKDLKIARELKQRLSEIVSLVDFKVYGSRARGNAGDHEALLLSEKENEKTESFGGVI